MNRRRALLSLIEYKQTESSIPTNEIWYTTSDGNIVTPSTDFWFGVTLISNVYIDDVGRLTFDYIIDGLGEGAFYECSSLTSITLPNSVAKFDDWSFAFCSSLTDITIPDSVTCMGWWAFKGCSSLTSITIPNSVTEIGGGAFYDCSSLTSVYCKATTPPSLDGTDVFYNNGSGRKIYVPAGSVEAYKSAEYWSEYASDIVGYNF